MNRPEPPDHVESVMLSLMVIPDHHHPTPPDDESICRNLFKYLSKNKQAFNQVASGNLYPGLAMPEDEDATCLVVTRADVGEELGLDMDPLELYDSDDYDDDAYRFVIQLAMHIPKASDDTMASNAQTAAEILLDCWNEVYISGDFPQACHALWRVNDKFGEVSAK